MRYGIDIFGKGFMQGLSGFPTYATTATTATTAAAAATAAAADDPAENGAQATIRSRAVEQAENVAAYDRAPALELAASLRDLRRVVENVAILGTQLPNSASLGKLCTRLDADIRKLDEDIKMADAKGGALQAVHIKGPADAIAWYGAELCRELEDGGSSNDAARAIIQLRQSMNLVRTTQAFALAAVAAVAVPHESPNQARLVHLEWALSALKRELANVATVPANALVERASGCIQRLEIEIAAAKGANLTVPAEIIDEQLESIRDVMTELLGRIASSDAVHVRQALSAVSRTANESAQGAEALDALRLPYSGAHESLPAKAVALLNQLATAVKDATRSSIEADAGGMEEMRSQIARREISVPYFRLMHTEIVSRAQRLAIEIQTARREAREVSAPILLGELAMCHFLAVKTKQRREHDLSGATRRSLQAQGLPLEMLDDELRKLSPLNDLVDAVKPLRLDAIRTRPAAQSGNARLMELSWWLRELEAEVRERIDLDPGFDSAAAAGPRSLRQRVLEGIRALDVAVQHAARSPEPLQVNELRVLFHSLRTDTNTLLDHRKGHIDASVADDYAGGISPLQTEFSAIESARHMLDAVLIELHTAQLAAIDRRQPNTPTPSVTALVVADEEKDSRRSRREQPDASSAFTARALHGDDEDEDQDQGEKEQSQRSGKGCVTS